MITWRTRITCCLLVFASAGIAQHDISHHTEQLGTVHFASSCNAPAQQELDRAVALLHSFEFGRAITGFHTTLDKDKTCGIANWGIALSQWGNPFAAGLKEQSRLQAARATVEQGLRSGAKTERERDYIAAAATLYANFENTPQRVRLIAYRDAMGKLAAHYSADNEGQIFYAMALAASEDPADKTYADRMKAGRILEHMFEQEPNHPGLAHYIIHTYDVPSLAVRALPAARRYSEIAPDAPHALHMPSHIFTRTGYWQDSIAGNVAAAGSAKRHGETEEELHASDYQIYAYLQSGQDEAARRLASSLDEIAMRFDPKKAMDGPGGPLSGYFALAAIPARYALERGDWKEAGQLSPRESPFPYTAAMTWLARGLGSARLGQAKPAYEAAAALKQIREQLARSGDSYWTLQVGIEEEEVRAWASFAEGRKDDAIRRLDTAAKLEDGTEKSAVTPGPLAPAHELLGEMFLAAKQPALALEQFAATLKKEPGRFRSLYGAGRAAQASGRIEESRQYFRDLLKICERADNPGRPELMEARRVLLQNPSSAQ